MTDLRADSMTGEQYVFEERTSDPSSTVEGERWLRTDLTSGDKIATLRVDVGGSTLDVPVFPTGTSEDGVTEALRVRVGSQTGYIPAIADTSAAGFPQLRLQHDGQVYGYHNEQGVFAFFDVAISSTNSPVNEGSDLNVDYSVQNTGFSANNTQDIRLQIDTVEEDRDTNITLSPGSSTTGTLTWTTPSSSAGTYNASVLSDDDTASTSVTVEEVAIPDSGNLYARYDSRELGLSDQDTVSTWPDEVGSADLSALGAPVYETNIQNGNPAVFYDGTDDAHEATSGVFGTVSQPFTVYLVVIDPADNALHALFGDNTAAKAWTRFEDDGNYSVNWGSYTSSGAYGFDTTIITARIDGSNSVIRDAGTEALSGDFGANGLEGILLGVLNDGAGKQDWYGGHFGEIDVYDVGHNNATINEVESYLSDGWGIAV